jgi:F-type H+-transporting ATPase subunit a
MCNTLSIIFKPGALVWLKLAVAFIQAYVFAILTCIYLNEAENLH